MEVLNQSQIYQNNQQIYHLIRLPNVLPIFPIFLKFPRLLVILPPIPENKFFSKSLNPFPSTPSSILVGFNYENIRLNAAPLNKLITFVVI